MANDRIDVRSFFRMRRAYRGHNCLLVLFALKVAISFDNPQFVRPHGASGSVGKYPLRDMAQRYTASQMVDQVLSVYESVLTRSAKR